MRREKEGGPDTGGSHRAEQGALSQVLTPLERLSRGTGCPGAGVFLERPITGITS